MNLSNYTVKAQEILQQAQQIAFNYQQANIETEHLLKALLEQQDSPVEWLLKKNTINTNNINCIDINTDNINTDNINTNINTNNNNRKPLMNINKQNININDCDDNESIFDIIEKNILKII